MKLLLFIFIPHLLISQKNRLAIDNELLPYVEEICMEADNRMWYSFRHNLIKKCKRIKIDTIVTYDTTYRDKLTGASDAKSKTIWINASILDDTLLVKLTVWHEIGHLLKYNFPLLHTCDDCNDIMGAFFPSDLSIYKDKAQLKKLIDDYFIFIYKSYGLIKF